MANEFIRFIRFKNILWMKIIADRTCTRCAPCLYHAPSFLFSSEIHCVAQRWRDLASCLKTWWRHEDMMNLPWLYRSYLVLLKQSETKQPVKVESDQILILSSQLKAESENIDGINLCSYLWDIWNKESSITLHINSHPTANLFASCRS